MTEPRVARRYAWWIGLVALGVAATGLLVLVLGPKWQTTAVHWWAATDDPAVLVVCVDSATNEDARVDVTEGASAVTLIAKTKDRAGVGASVGTGLYVRLEAHLEAPLGARQVVDQEGTPLPQSDAGSPPC